MTSGGQRALCGLGEHDPGRAHLRPVAPVGVVATVTFCSAASGFCPLLAWSSGPPRRACGLTQALPAAPGAGPRAWDCLRWHQARPPPLSSLAATALYLCGQPLLCPHEVTKPFLTPLGHAPSGHAQLPPWEAPAGCRWVAPSAPCLVLRLPCPPFAFRPGLSFLIRKVDMMLPTTDLRRLSKRIREPLGKTGALQPCPTLRTHPPRNLLQCPATLSSEGC